MARPSQVDLHTLVSKLWIRTEFRGLVLVSGPQISIHSNLPKREYKSKQNENRRSRWAGMHSTTQHDRSNSEDKSAIPSRYLHPFTDIYPSPGPPLHTRKVSSPPSLVLPIPSQRSQRGPQMHQQKIPSRLISSHPIPSGRTHRIVRVL